MPGEAVENGPGVWASADNEEDLKKPHGSWIEPCPALTLAAIGGSGYKEINDLNVFS